MKHLSLAVFMPLLTLGVAVSPGHAADSVKLDIASIETATVNDLNIAKVDADAHNDVFASQCYAGAAAYVSAHPVSLPSLPSSGVVSAFQVARDAVKVVQAAKSVGAVPPELVQACGPLALDVQNDLGKAVADFTILGIRL